MKISNIYILTILSVFLFIGCKKEGPPGPAGPSGKDGVDGNSNIISKSITTSLWVQNDSSWSLGIPINEITEEIIFSGAVFVYYGQPPIPSLQLPAEFGSTITGFTKVVFEQFIGGVKLHCYNTDGTLPRNPNPSVIKVIIISSND